MFKDFAVKKAILKNGLSKYRNQNIRQVYNVHLQSIFQTILLHFSPYTLHHLHIFIVLLWSVLIYLLLWRKGYLSYSFSEERCIFQGGGLTPRILCKSLIQYLALKLQSCQLKKLHRDRVWKSGGLVKHVCFSNRSSH